MLLKEQARQAAQDEQTRIYSEKVRQYSEPSTDHEVVLLCFYRNLLNDLQDKTIQDMASL